jgi:hypothetical protein
MTLQKSVIAFLRPCQSTIISQAINALQLLSLSKDKQEDPIADQPMQPKGLQQIVDGPLLVADVATRARLPCNPNTVQTTKKKQYASLSSRGITQVELLKCMPSCQPPHPRELKLEATKKLGQEQILA